MHFLLGERRLLRGRACIVPQFVAQLRLSFVQMLRRVHGVANQLGMVKRFDLAPQLIDATTLIETVEREPRQMGLPVISAMVGVPPVPAERLRNLRDDVLPLVFGDKGGVILAPTGAGGSSSGGF